ncbi:AraC family transcriptional regulator [Cohnella faecalis]|uniref:AraC family transcriptional regulator n=1 Tax=Cohnella faecalis TaxID=2315694 RepID=A0A398CJG3_9BACL|nr:AraC family transcriptional regulator [Cohnella faecalis]RIE02460.1 AraC family transcriptional regulator [Cohnella faecalis]
MHVLGRAKAPLRELSFQLRQVELVTCTPECVYAKKPADVHTLLVCGNGKGKLYKDDEVLLFSRASAFLLPPQASYQFKSSDDQPVECCKITFSVTRMDPSGSPKLFRDELFPHRNELRVYPSSQLMEMAEAIYRGEEQQEGMAYFEQNMDFLKLMNFVLRQHLPSDEDESSAVVAVERTVRYLQLHYFDKITVGQLERLSGLPSGQYSAVFKELTGKKPLDYLTELRIRHSQSLLLETNESLRHIAERVGFTDEYYFNRRFRQTTGMSPRQYAASMKGRVRVRDWAGHDVIIPAKPSRIMFYGETIEDLLALGIQPVGGGCTVETAGSILKTPRC